MSETTYTLILLRHGESEWNALNLFTGWVDVNLTAKGEQEAANGGQMLLDKGILPDVAHTSLQKRAIRTTQIALENCERHWVPVRRSWRLNERHYGALQGKDKKETLQKYGEAKFTEWRRSYDVPPPPIDPEDPHAQTHDPRYAELAPEIRPAAECLKDVVERMLPYWYDGIVPDLRVGRTVLVGAHGNSLRGLVKHLEGMSDEAVIKLNIPTGIPLVYRLDENLKPLVAGGEYVDPEAAAAAAAAVANQGKEALQPQPRPRAPIRARKRAGRGPQNPASRPLACRKSACMSQNWQVSHLADRINGPRINGPGSAPRQRPPVISAIRGRTSSR